MTALLFLERTVVLAHKGLQTDTGTVETDL